MSWDDEPELTPEGRSVLADAEDAAACTDCERVEIFAGESAEPVVSHVVRPCPVHAWLSLPAPLALDRRSFEVWLNPEVRVDAYGIPYVYEGRKPPVDWRG